MTPTPQLDELFAGLTVSVDVLDNLRDKAVKGGKIGFPDLLSAAITANGPVAKGADGEGKFGTELRAFVADRETAGHIGKQFGYLVHDTIKQFSDLNN